jgi:hypothetical protein
MGSDRQSELDKWIERIEREDRIGKAIVRMRARHREICRLLGMPEPSPDTFPENRGDQDRSAA